jgi:hypothetical protein
MGVKEKIEERIKKKELEIQEHEAMIRESRAAIQAFQDTLKLLPKELTDDSSEAALRPGSGPYQVYELIKKNGRAMHISEILKGIGKEATKENKVSLAGTLGFYVRKGELFTRPAPNTFSINELDAKEVEEAPPDDFGLVEGEE